MVMPMNNLVKVRSHNRRILVIGCGGIACELVKLLWLHEERDLTLIDYDTISISNLNRQFLFKKSDVGCHKSKEMASKYFQKLNRRVIHDFTRGRNDQQNSVQTSHFHDSQTGNEVYNPPTLPHDLPNRKVGKIGSEKYSMTTGTARGSIQCSIENSSDSESMPPKSHEYPRCERDSGTGSPFTDHKFDRDTILSRGDSKTNIVIDVESPHDTTFVNNSYIYDPCNKRVKNTQLVNVINTQDTESALKDNTDRPNPSIKYIIGNILSYDATFLAQFDMIFNCLDNVEARKHVNFMIVLLRKSLVFHVSPTLDIMESSFEDITAENNSIFDIRTIGQSHPITNIQARVAGDSDQTDLKTRKNNFHDSDRSDQSNMSIFVDGGSTGFLGQSWQYHSDFECYECSYTPPEQEEIPVCTLRTKPTKFEHCISWAQSAFFEYLNHFKIHFKANTHGSISKEDIDGVFNGSGKVSTQDILERLPCILEEIMYKDYVEINIQNRDILPYSDKFHERMKHEEMKTCSEKYILNSNQEIPGRNQFPGVSTFKPQPGFDQTPDHVFSSLKLHREPNKFACDPAVEPQLYFYQACDRLSPSLEAQYLKVDGFNGNSIEKPHKRVKVVTYREIESYSTCPNPDNQESHLLPSTDFEYSGCDPKARHQQFYDTNLHPVDVDKNSESRDRPENKHLGGVYLKNSYDFDASNGVLSICNDINSNNQLPIESPEGYIKTTSDQFCEIYTTSHVTCLVFLAIRIIRLVSYPSTSKTLKIELSDLLNLINLLRAHLMREKTLVLDKDDQISLDLMYMASKLRGQAFGLEIKDKLSSETISARIVPAVCTTNSIVAGLMYLSALNAIENLPDTNYYISNTPKLLKQTKLINQNENCQVCTKDFFTFWFSDSTAKQLTIRNLHRILTETTDTKFKLRDCIYLRGSKILYDVAFTENPDFCINVGNNDIVTFTSEDTFFYLYFLIRK